MKNKTTINIISVPLLVIAAITSATAAEQPATQVVFRTERGDTFGNLFVDWQKAYDQNRTTVIRHGKLVTSPDILLEGAILHVTGDIRLTPRAIERLDSLVKRRAALRQRLAGLTGSAEPAALRAMELRRMLNDDLRYAGDVAFIEHEVSKLETVDLPVPGPAKSTRIWALAGPSAAAIFLAWFAHRRRRKDGPGGEERMKAVLRDLDQALHMWPTARKREPTGSRMNV